MGQALHADQLLPAIPTSLSLTELTFLCLEQKLKFGIIHLQTYEHACCVLCLHHGCLDQQLLLYQGHQDVEDHY